MKHLANKLIQEPPRPPTPEPTVTIYERDPRSRKAFQDTVPKSEIASEDDWKKIEIKLVGKTELWGHYLWV